MGDDKKNFDERFKHFKDLDPAEIEDAAGSNDILYGTKFTRQEMPKTE